MIAGIFFYSDEMLMDSVMYVTVFMIGRCKIPILFQLP